MTYQVRPEEKEKWQKTVWHSRGTDKAVSELPKGYAKNIVKFIKRRYNAKYYETYIDNSPLWIALCAQAGVSPVASEEEEPSANTDSSNTVSEVSASSSAKPSASTDIDLLNSTIDNQVHNIETGQATMEQVKNTLLAIKVSLNS